MRATSRRGWIAFGLAVGAVGWGLLLVPWALLSPAYHGLSCEAVPGGTCTSTSATLVAVNGTGVLVWVALPALAAVLGWLLLHRACAERSRAAVNGAWLLVLVLLAFSFVTGFSIGLFVLPIPLLLGASALLVEW
jgi:hypothetical protein